MSSKIFGTLTLIALAVACFIGLKNKAAYQVEIDARKDVERKLVNTKDRLAKAVQARDETLAANDAMTAEIPKAEAQKSEQEKSNADLTTEKTAKTTEAEGNKAKLDAAREKTAALGNIKDLASKMGSMIGELKGLEDSVKDSETRLASLTTENTGVENRVAKQREDSEKRSKGESLAGLRTYVSAVYPSWGFVTLGAGNTAGVITNSTLDVVRDDEVIAKLLVTAVERNTASASIIPDTVKADVTIQTGDQVVPGVKVSTPAPAAAPAPIPAN